MVVYVNDDYKLIANNVLTPNGDGVNDFWEIENIQTFGTSDLAIFDRWGNQIYTAKGYTNTWNGTSGNDILPDGAYYYVITFEESTKVYKGTITILRDK